MNQAKKLIEVAMPVKEISAESVRDKSIRHGHISTLHLWWARRPLPVCRAVVFASLVPDPLDENCPSAFRDAVDDLLGPGDHGDPYKPYRDIPYTAGFDPMEDNRRNRLLMFIGKFSDVYIQNEKTGKTTPAKDLLSDFSLIKWDNKNNEAIINKARKLIWVAHNSQVSVNENSHAAATPIMASEAKQSLDYQHLSLDFDVALAAIKSAEADLYAHPDRHLQTEDVTAKEAALQHAIDAFLDRMPKVFDPFAGGGAIPLEAARLGCRTYANDLNPVAHIIEKGSLEFPQKYGKPILYSRHEFIKLYPDLFNGELGVGDGQTHYGTDVLEIDGVDDALAKLEQIEASEYIRVHNRLAFDVEYYAKKLLRMTEAEIGHLYPADENGNKPIAYYWVYYAKCSNPSCQADVPMLKNYYLVNKSDRKVYLQLHLKNCEITYSIQKGEHNQNPTFEKKKLICPFCKNVTNDKELKSQFAKKTPIKKLIAVIDSERNGEKYRLPRLDEVGIEDNLKRENEIFEEITQNDSRSLWLTIWGVQKWSEMFSNRQLLFLNALLSNINELMISNENHYSTILKTYLTLWFDRIAIINTSFGRWNIARETLEHPFSRQGIAMMFDFPEVNPFSSETGSSINMLSWIIRFLESEQNSPFQTLCNNSSSGEKNQFEKDYLTSVVTDPPYYDAVPYADLSDFFYVWMKRILTPIYPINFATPKSPKTDECTALKHYHDGNSEKASLHFENKLLQIFDAIEYQTSEIVSIMFAHQSTKAWTTLCNSILGARMNITGSWAIDTEMASRTVALAGAALVSSVTVACRPSTKIGYGEFKKVRESISQKVLNEVSGLYKLGFRGADLLTACFGQAVSEFGKYERVEKADGSEVTVAELLDMARESAFNAIISDIDTDDVTRFYIGWLNLFGFTEAEHDDVRRITQIGLSINVTDLLADHILIRNGSKESLATVKERTQALPRLGEKPEGYTIDRVHKAMSLYSGNRHSLIKYIAEYAESPLSVFWRVLNSLKEILPAGIDDEKLVSGLLANKDSLIREAKNIKAQSSEQLGLEL